MGKVRKAIIPAAGFGTRFLPATKAQPKEMLPIVDTPAIQYIVEEALASGIEEILIITGRNKRAIEDHSIPVLNWTVVTAAGQEKTVGHGSFLGGYSGSLYSSKSTAWIG